MVRSSLVYIVLGDVLKCNVVECSIYIYHILKYLVYILYIYIELLYEQSKVQHDVKYTTTQRSITLHTTKI